MLSAQAASGPQHALCPITYPHEPPLRLPLAHPLGMTRHPASGYVQGMNDLVTPFLAVFLSEHLSGDIDAWSAADLEEVGALGWGRGQGNRRWCGAWAHTRGLLSLGHCLGGRGMVMAVTDCTSLQYNRAVGNCGQVLPALLVHSALGHCGTHSSLWCARCQA